MAITLTWNAAFEASPADGDAVSAGAGKIRGGFVATRERAEREHIWGTSETNADHGIHRQGSAICYNAAAASAPSNMPDAATSLANNTKSNGRLWLKSDQYVLAGYNGGAWIGVGCVPVGTVVAWIPGYFSSGGLSGYVAVLTVASNLPADWKLCDGSAPNDSNSPIFNTASRYLPNITADRFIQGDVEGSVGGVGGSNVLIDHNHSTHQHFIMNTGNPSGSSSPVQAGTYATRELSVGADDDYKIQGSGTVSSVGLTSATQVGTQAVPSSTNSRPVYMSAMYIIRIK